MPGIRAAEMPEIQYRKPPGKEIVIKKWTGNYPRHSDFFGIFHVVEDPVPDDEESRRAAPPDHS